MGLITENGVTYFVEELHSGYSQRFAVKKILCDAVSDYQKIQILDLENFGRVLALDGIIQFSEVDEHIYHETLVHPAMMVVNGNRKKVLIVGGGDLLAAREVLKHDDVEEVTVCDIDQSVIEVCLAHLKDMQGGVIHDKRFEFLPCDAIDFVGHEPDNSYDVIVLDRPDPVGPAEGLFSTEFYDSVRRILKPGGAVVCQSGIMFWQGSEMFDTFCYWDQHTTTTVLTITAPIWCGGPMALVMAVDGISAEEIGARVSKAVLDSPNLTKKMKFMGSPFAFANASMLGISMVDQLTSMRKE